jgi:hypothetical protein
MSDDDPAVDAEALTPIEVVIERSPLVCVWCGSTDNEGPWGDVYFCNGCGRTIRRGESQYMAWTRARLQATRDREIRQQRARRPR